MVEKTQQGVKWLPLILILFICAGLWQLTPPSGLSAPAWHSAIIFVATIASIVAKVLPIGAVGIIGITVFALAYAAGDKTASGVLSWEDVKSEKGAWDTLIWFAALLMMANQLKKLGFTTWFGNLIGDSLSSTMHGTSWVVVLLLLNAAYFYTHYFFASGNAQIAALYAVFLGVGLHLNIPAAPTALMLAFTSSLYCSLTQYTHARGPILFGAGYVPMGVWWRTGFIISLFNQAVFITVGLMWWKILGLY